MNLLDDLLEVKYTLAQGYINNSDFDNIEFAPVNFELSRENITEFSKEARDYPTLDGKPSRARRDSDGRLIIRRPYDGIVKRLRKINELDYMFVGDKLIDKERIPPEKAMFSFRKFEHEYSLDIDLRSDENFLSLLESLSSTNPNPQFLECTLKKQNRFTKDILSEEPKYLIDVTNKYWNSTSNKHCWFSVFYISDSKNELKQNIVDNLDKTSRRRRENYLIDKLMAEDAKTSLP